MKYIIFSICFSLVLSGCGMQQDVTAVSPILTNEDVAVIDLDKAQRVDTLYFSDYFKQPKTIVLETSPDCIIKDVTGLEIFKNTIYILDGESYALYKFDLNGNFLGKIGERGNGHGEYYSADDFSIDRKKGILYLWDDDSDKIHKYKLDTGKHIESVEISRSGEQSSSMQYYRGKLYVDNMNSEQDKEHYAINMIDPGTGRVEAKYMESLRYNNGVDAPISFQHSFFYAKNAHSPKFIDMFADTIVALTPNGIMPVYAVKSKRLVNFNDTKDLEYSGGKLNSGEFFQKIAREKKIWGMYSYTELKNKISFEYNDGEDLAWLFYDNNTRKSMSTKLFTNDYIVKKGSITTRLCYSDNKGAIALLDQKYISPFIEYIVSQGLLNKNCDGYQKLMKLKPDSNPVLFYHKYK